VGFRASCLRRATDAGLGGWVRNTEAGDVEAVFEGPSPAVDALVQWCRTGPSWANVERVEITDDPPRGETAFTIR
jgi:acylphosphatase